MPGRKLSHSEKPALQLLGPWPKPLPKWNLPDIKATPLAALLRGTSMVPIGKAQSELTQCQEV